MSLSLETRVNQVSQNLELMRTVTLTVYHQADATEQMRMAGSKFGPVISPNCFVLPPTVDILDPSKLKTLRKIWLDKARAHLDESVPVIGMDETPEEKLVRLIEAATKKELFDNQAFIAAAKYPVPSEYAVMLPLHSSDLRHEIIDCLVPFKQSCGMLHRLEEELELPMRVVTIGHVRTHAVDELKRSIN